MYFNLDCLYAYWWTVGRGFKSLVLLRALFTNHVTNVWLVERNIVVFDPMTCPTFEHFIWLQPSFFCIWLLQLGQGLQLVTSHRQFAASSVSTPEVCSCSGLIWAIFDCHCCHCWQPLGACASPRHSLQHFGKYSSNDIHLPTEFSTIGCCFQYCT